MYFKCSVELIYFLVSPALLLGVNSTCMCECVHDRAVIVCLCRGGS